MQQSTRAESQTSLVEAKTELQIEVKNYLIALRQAGRTTGTIEKYNWQLGRFLDWLAQRGITQLADLTRPLLREWGAGLYELKCKTDPKTRIKPEAIPSTEVTADGKGESKEKSNGKAGKVKGWEPASIRQATIVIRCFVHWCYKENLISQDLAGALEIPKDKRRMQRTLNDDEIQTLVDACDVTTVKGIRDLALVSLLTDSGLRSLEVRHLTEEDLYFDVKLGEELVNVMIITGKGDNQAPAFFGHVTADRLRDWLKVRRPEEGVDELFISLGGNTPGQAFTRHGLRTTLNKLGKKVGVEGVTPHAFRRSFACIADDAGASTRKIQLWGRWSDIKMVERYTLALKAGKQYNRYSPIDYLEAKRQNGKDSTEQES